MLEGYSDDDGDDDDRLRIMSWKKKRQKINEIFVHTHTFIDEKKQILMNKKRRTTTKYLRLKIRQRIIAICPFFPLCTLLTISFVI